MVVHWQFFCRLLSLSMPRLTFLYLEAVDFDIESAAHSSMCSDTEQLDLSLATALIQVHTSLPDYCALVKLPAPLEELGFNTYLTSPHDWQRLHDMFKDCPDLRTLTLGLDVAGICGNPILETSFPLPNIFSLHLIGSERGILEVLKSIDIGDLTTLGLHVENRPDNGVNIPSFPTIPNLNMLAVGVHQWTPMIRGILSDLPSPESFIHLMLRGSVDVSLNLQDRPVAEIATSGMQVDVSALQPHWRYIFSKMTFEYLLLLALDIYGIDGLEGDAFVSLPNFQLHMPVLEDLKVAPVTRYDVQNFATPLLAPRLERFYCVTGETFPRPHDLAATPIPMAYSIASKVSISVSLDHILPLNTSYENPLGLFPNASFMEIILEFGKIARIWVEVDAALDHLLTYLLAKPEVHQSLVKFVLKIPGTRGNEPLPNLVRCKNVLLGASHARGNMNLPNLACKLEVFSEIQWEICNQEAAERVSQS
jgi:hypothetical protein